MTFGHGEAGVQRFIGTGGRGTGIPALANLCLFLMMIAISLGPHTSAFLKEEGGTGVVRQAIYLSLLLLALLSVKPWEDLRRLLCLPLPLLLALGLCAATLSWSAVPGIGARRLILTACMAWTIALLVRQLGYERSLIVLRYAMFVLLVANYVAVFLFPGIGIHQVGDQVDEALAGDWCGIMAHKNFAGALMAFTIFFFLFDAQRLNPLLRTGVLVAAGAFLFFSESKTSVGMCVGSLVIGYLFGRISFSLRLAILPMLAIASLSATVYLNTYRYVFIQMLNDPAMFTGRIVIWRHLANYISDHPWTGSGYGSFWGTGPNAPIYRYSADWVSRIHSGHNGYLDLAVTVGVPFGICILGLLFIWPFLRLLISTRTTGGRGALLLSLLTFCAGHNITESSILDRDVITNVMLVLTVTLLWELASSRLWIVTPAEPEDGEEPEAPRDESWKGRTAMPF